MNQNMTLDEILTYIYEHLDEIFSAVQIVILALLNRKMKLSTPAVAPSLAPTVAAEPQPAEPTKAELKAAKKETSSQMTKDLELFYSGKKLEDMTDDEKQAIARITSYLGGA